MAYKFGSWSCGSGANPQDGDARQQGRRAPSLWAEPESRFNRAVLARVGPESEKSDHRTCCFSMAPIQIVSLCFLARICKLMEDI
jgi:hypothetical protein